MGLAVFGVVALHSRVMARADSPPLSANPTSVTFPDTPEYTVSSPIPVVLTTTQPIDISAVYAGDPDFGVTGCASGNLAAGSSCTLEVTFAPLSTGLIIDKYLQVEYSFGGGGGGNIYLNIQLQGTGTAGSGTPQTVTFTSSAPTNAVVGGATYTPIATGGASGEPVVITVDGTSTAVCFISGGVVSFFGVGTCTLDANQAGNASYSAATQVQQSFSVGSGGGGGGGGGGPTITKFTPTSGPAGTLVTITGTNLSTTEAVEFRGAEVLVTSASATQVTVKVPANATSGPFTLLTFSGDTTSLQSFKVTSAAITSFSPSSGAPGTKVTITGANLAHAQVSFDGTAAKIKSDSAKRIVVIVPTGAKSGTITVTTKKAGSATSTQSFTVT